MKAHPELLLRWSMRVRKSFLRENKKSKGMQNVKLRRASHYLTGEESAEIPVCFSFNRNYITELKKSLLWQIENILTKRQRWILIQAYFLIKISHWHFKRGNIILISSFVNEMRTTQGQAPSINQAASHVIIIQCPLHK
jgi:hypothetical protein